MNFEKYENKLPVNLKDRSEQGKAAYRAYQAVGTRLQELFKQDLFIEFDVVGNPKAEQALNRTIVGLKLPNHCDKLHKSLNLFTFIFRKRPICLLY